MPYKLRKITNSLRKREDTDALIADKESGVVVMEINVMRNV